MIEPSIIDAMVAAGASPKVIAAAIRADYEIEASKLSAKRQKNRDRMRSVRARSRTGVHNYAQTCTESPSKVPPITPLNTPQGSEPKGSAADAAIFTDFEILDEDPKAKLFRVGKTTLASWGVAEKRMGPLLGMWLKARADPAGILSAIQFARDQNVSEPVSYITALLNGKGKQNGHGKQDLTAMCFALADEWRRKQSEGAFDGTLDLSGGH